MPRKKKAKGPAPKRINVEAWITEGLRLAVGGLVRTDGKPATEEQVREWCQTQMDDATSTVVDEYEQCH